MVIILFPDLLYACRLADRLQRESSRHIEGPVAPPLTPRSGSIQAVSLVYLNILNSQYPDRLSRLPLDSHSGHLDSSAAILVLEPWLTFAKNAVAPGCRLFAGRTGSSSRRAATARSRPVSNVPCSVLVCRSAIAASRCSPSNQTARIRRSIERSTAPGDL